MTIEEPAFDPFQIDVDLDSLFLDTDNPRHKPVDTPAQAMLRLCESENVYELAEDIAQRGLNPLEIFAVTPSGANADPQTGPFVVVEGNRRLCALKLLSDPTGAPPAQRDKFAKLAQVFSIQTVPAWVFPDKDSARPWLERLHSGEFSGRGRKAWNAEQKARFLGGGRHGRAQAALDLAEQLGFITEEEREGKLSVVDRWLANPVFREALGIDFDKSATTPRITRPEDEFKALFRTFIDWVKLGAEKGGVSTRQNTKDMRERARQIEATVAEQVKSGKMTGARIDPAEIGAALPAAAAAGSAATSPKKPRFLRLPHSARIEEALGRLGWQKPRMLYHSLTTLPLDHVALLTVGLWTFMEIVTAATGKNDGTAISDYLSDQRLPAYGFTTKPQRKALRPVLLRVSEAGNLTKHDPKAGMVDANQLVNDVETLEPLLVALIDDATAKAGSSL